MFPGGKLPGEDFINSWYPIAFALVLGLIVGIRNYFRGPACRSNVGVKGKVTVVTGGTTGIGREIAREMALRGSRVIIAGRNEELAKESIEEIRRSAKTCEVEFMKLDLASFASVRSFAKALLEKTTKINYLFNNAGVMSQPYKVSADGFETHFQVNYLGHVLLTELLLDRLKASAPARVVSTLAPAYSLATPQWFQDPNFVQDPTSYTTTQSLAGSKVSVFMYSRHVAKQLEGSGVTVNCVLPGIVNTNYYDLMPFRQSSILRLTFSPIFWFFSKTSYDGAQTPVHVAVAAEEADVSGKIYKDLQIVEASDKIPPPELDGNWVETTLEAINRPAGERASEKVVESKEKEKESEEKEDACEEKGDASEEKEDASEEEEDTSEEIETIGGQEKDKSV